MSQLKAIKSPCVTVCRMDRTSELCFGCGRTRGEIALWMSYSDVERDEIMATLPARLKPLQDELARKRLKRRLDKDRTTP